MKRQWYPVRIVLALMQLSIAAVAVAFWMKTPRYVIPAKNILGFNLAHQLVLTTNIAILGTGLESQESEGRYRRTEITSWDMTTGQKKAATVLPDFFPQKDSRDRKAVMSFDCSRIALWHEDGSTIFVYGLPEEKLCWQFQAGDQVGSIPPGKGELLTAVSFSEDGRWLAASSITHVYVWDLQHGGIVHNLRREVFWYSTVARAHESVQISKDHHYLMVANYTEGVCVFDLNQKRELAGYVKNTDSTEQVPARPDFRINWSRLLSDNRTVLLLKEGNQATVNRVGISENNLSELSPMAISKEEAVIALVEDTLVTIEPRKPMQIAWSTWIPNVCARWFKACISWFESRYKEDCILRFRDGYSGSEMFRLSVRLNGVYHPGFLSRSIGSLCQFWPSKIAISTDGQWLGMTDGKQIDVWHLPPRRSVLCWLTAGGLSMLAIWLAWPRRVKIASFSIQLKQACLRM